MGKNMLQMFLYFGVVPLVISFITMSITTNNFLITTILPLIIGGCIAGGLQVEHCSHLMIKEGLVLCSSFR